MGLSPKFRSNLVMFIVCKPLSQPLSPPVPSIMHCTSLPQGPPSTTIMCRRFSNLKRIPCHTTRKVAALDDVVCVIFANTTKHTTSLTAGLHLYTHRRDSPACVEHWQRFTRRNSSQWVNRQLVLLVAQTSQTRRKLQPWQSQTYECHATSRHACRYTEAGRSMDIVRHAGDQPAGQFNVLLSRPNDDFRCSRGFISASYFALYWRISIVFKRHCTALHWVARRHGPPPDSPPARLASIYRNSLRRLGWIVISYKSREK